MLTVHLQYAFCTITLLNRNYKIFAERNRTANKQAALRNFKVFALTTLDLKSEWVDENRTTSHVPAWT